MGRARYSFDPSPGLARGFVVAATKYESGGRVARADSSRVAGRVFDLTIPGCLAELIQNLSPATPRVPYQAPALLAPILVLLAQYGAAAYWIWLGYVSAVTLSQIGWFLAGAAVARAVLLLRAATLCWGSPGTLAEAGTSTETLIPFEAVAEFEASRPSQRWRCRGGYRSRGTCGRSAH